MGSFLLPLDRAGDQDHIHLVVELQRGEIERPGRAVRGPLTPHAARVAGRLGLLRPGLGVTT